MRKCTLFLTLILSIPILLPAQWSSDPTENLEVKNSGDWEAVPHIVTDQDGISYVSWFSGHNLNFNVYLQQLDANGNMMLGTDGLLISDHPTDTWVTDYSLIRDDQGNAILVTQDQRTGNSDVFAYKMSHDGDFLWGDDGIQLSNDSNFDPFPKVVMTGAGEFIFSWMSDPSDTTQPSVITLQKLSPDGEKLWGDGLVLTDTLRYFMDRIMMTDDGNLMVVWESRKLPQHLPPGAPDWFHIKAQKFDLNGNALWPNPVQVDTGELMDYLTTYAVPQLAPDGNGGVFVCWHSGMGGFKMATFVQHLDADGNLLFNDGPLTVSTNFDSDQIEPVVCQIASIQDLIIFWREIYYDDINLRYCYSVFGQRLTGDGTRLWGDYGKQFVDYTCLDSTYFDLEVVPGTDNDLALFYVNEYLTVQPPDTMVTDNIYASRINSDGDLLWENKRIPVGATSGTKYDLQAGRFAEDQWVLVWNELRGESSDPSYFGIYAQNVTKDGILGPLAVTEVVVDAIDVQVYPNPVNDRSTVRLQLPAPALCRLDLYRMDGQLIRNVCNKCLGSGQHIFELNGTGMPSGVCFLHATIGDSSRIIKVLIMH